MKRQTLQQQIFIKLTLGSIFLIVMAIITQIYFPTILILVSIISVVTIFIIATLYFKQLFQSIEVIQQQITNLEVGERVLKIKNGEDNFNDIIDRLNIIVLKNEELLTVTQKQAVKTQWLSLSLEADASHTVEKLYELSTVDTMQNREQLLELTELLDEITTFYYNDENKVKNHFILEKIDKIRDISQNRTAATTEITITLSDLLKSLQQQSSDLSDISTNLLNQIEQFKKREAK